MGVITPAAADDVAASASLRIGVICTEGTHASGIYPRAIRALAPRAYDKTGACPLLVPLAEEGWQRHAVATRLIASAYLAPLIEARIDVLLLGCTHYPLLVPVLGACVGPPTRLLDGSAAVAHHVVQELSQRALLAPRRFGADAFFATDMTARLARIGSQFLQAPMAPVQRVALPDP